MKYRMSSILIMTLALSGIHTLAAGLSVIPLPAESSNDKQILYNDKGKVAGSEVYYDKASGNVGIGTDTPEEKLDVSGTVNASAFTAGGVPVLSSSGTLWSFNNDDIFANTNDVIVIGSLALGQDASSGLDFSFDSQVIKDPDIRILFDDTSVSASFPKNDWRFTFNDNFSGGDDYFAIDDATGGTRPFVIEAGAPDNSIYVAGTSGNVGIGTNTPESSLQVSGYLQLDVVAGTPPGGDCDNVAEIGRMIVDSGAETLYVCTASGWDSK